MAAGDLTDRTAVKQQLETAVTTEDSRIDTLISAASRAIPRWAGREFVSLVAGEQTRTIDVGPFACAAYSDGVPVGDMAATPSAVEILAQDGSIVATLTVASDIVALPMTRDPDQPIRALRFRPSAPAPLECQQLRVTGTFGFPAVPVDVAQACIVTVLAWLRRDSQVWADEGGYPLQQAGAAPPGGWMLPMAAKQLLNPFRRRALA